MCESCESTGFDGNPARAASTLLDKIADSMGTMVNGGVRNDFPDTWEVLSAAVAELDLLCMEHLEGDVGEAVEGLAENDLFTCENCHKTMDIEDSVRQGDGRLVCAYCDEHRLFPVGGESHDLMGKVTAETRLLREATDE